MWTCVICLTLCCVVRETMSIWSASFKVSEDFAGLTTEQRMRAAIVFVQNVEVSTVKMSKATGEVSGLNPKDFIDEANPENYVYMTKSYVEYRPASVGISAPHSLKLPGLLDVGSRIYVRHKPDDSCQMYFLQLYGGDPKNVAVRIRVRFDWSQVSIKAKIGGSFTSTEVPPTFPFVRYTISEFTITVEETHFHIEANGQFLYDFTHKLIPTMELVNTVMFGASCDVHVYYVSASLRIN